jgi:hypothetical protein
MVEVPRACTLPTDAQPLRVAEFDALFTEAMAPAVRVSSTHLRVHLAAGDAVAATAQDLLRRETECCAFFTFTLRRSADSTTLDVRVPPEHVSVLDAVGHRAETARLTGRR